MSTNNLTPIAAAVKAFTPSPQQADFYSWIVNGAGSCILEAVAGAGKTTTLIEALKLMGGKIFFGAFNKDIANEIAARAGYREGLFVSTMHAAGFRAWRRAAGNVVVNADKCKHIFRAAVERNPDAGYGPLEGSVLKLVSLAKQAAVGITKRAEDPNIWLDLIEHYDIEVFDEETSTDNTDLIIKLARKTLEESVNLDNVSVDFDDMIYAPLKHNVRMFEHDWVLIDEAQDTNEARRLLALRLLKRGGRLVAVGDRHQAIYGFTGADSNSLDLIAQAVNADRLPLTTTFRCPKRVVQFAKTWVSHIEAASTAPEGLIIHSTADQLQTMAKPGDAVLCRFNAPLLEYVYKFIAIGVPALIQGRDIASGLQSLARRWKVKKLQSLLDRLEIYRERETAKYRVKEQEAKAAAVEDRVNCLTVIVNRIMAIDPNCTNPVQRVCEEIDKLFARGDDDKIDTSKVVLFTSIHKSKGREWNRVVWLQTGPSNWARKEWEQEQEDNLCYVAATRSKNELVLIDITVKKEAKEAQ